MTASLRDSRLSFHADDIPQTYVECPSCTKEYDDFTHLPRVLPCLHALCASCLESTASRGTVKCSTCDIRHSIPNGDIDLFRVDETRQFLVCHHKIQKRNPDILCQECCNRSKMAKSRCRECAQFLCVDCMDAHKRTKVTKKHNVLPFEELRDAPLDDFQQPRFCSLPGHEEQPFAFYCSSESCDRPVCALCAVAEHQESKGHDIRNIHEVYSEVKRNIEGLMSDVKHRTLSAQDTASSIQATVEKLETNAKQAVMQVDDVFDAAMKALERRRGEIRDKIQAKVRDKRKRLDEQLESITYHINCMEDANEFAGNVSSYGTVTELLFSKDTISDRLNHLREEEFDTVPHDNDELKFKQTGLGEDFNKHVKDLGEVWATSAYGPNTHVEVNDVTMNREQTILHMTLYDSEGLPQTEENVDIRVEVTDPTGHRKSATVSDSTGSSGHYKARFLGTMKGKHQATVYIHGTPLPKDHVFLVHHSMGVERLNLREKVPRDNRVHHSSRSMHTATPSDISDHLSPISDHMIGDVICPGFVFDATTANPLVEILEEGKTMKARQTKGNRTRRPEREHGRFSFYRGAMASRPLQKSGLYYYEVVVAFRILKLIRDEHVFEIALSKLTYIDRHPSVDCHPYAWSVSARGCHVCGKVCVQTWHNGQLLSHTAISPRVKSPAGTVNRLHYGFLLDTERKHWIVTDVKNKKLVTRFKNLVVSEMSEPLWPVFSVSSRPDVVSSVLSLRTGRVIEMIPDEALYALAP